MPLIVNILFFIIFFGGVGLCIWLYTQFEKIEIRQKAKKIIRIYTEHENNFFKNRIQLDDLDNQVQNQIHQIFDAAYNNIIAKKTIDAIECYSGIGPSTLQLLTTNGVDNLILLERANLEAIKGIGPKRASDIRSALRQLKNDIRSRLNSGSCPESVVLQDRIKNLKNEMETKQVNIKQKIEDSRANLESLKKPVDVARTVTFIGWLFNHPMPVSIPDPIPINFETSHPVNPGSSTPIPTPQSFPKTAQLPEQHGRDLSGKNVKSIQVDRGGSVIDGSGLGKKQKASRNPIDFEKSQVSSVKPISEESSKLSPQAEMILWAKLAVAIGNVDGRLVDSEKLEIRRQLNEVFGSNPRLQSAIGSVVDEAASRKESLEAALESFLSNVENDRRQKCFQMLVKVARASGSMNIQEGTALSFVRDKLDPGRKKQGILNANPNESKLNGEKKRWKWQIPLPPPRYQNLLKIRGTPSKFWNRRSCLKPL